MTESLFTTFALNSRNMRSCTFCRQEMNPHPLTEPLFWAEGMRGSVGDHTSSLTTSLWTNKKVIYSSLKMSLSLRSPPALTVCFTVTRWAWAMRSSPKHFIQTLIFKRSFFSPHPIHESLSLWVTPCCPSFSIAVYHRFVSLQAFFLNLSLILSFRLPASSSLHPALFGLIIDVRRSVSLAGWGGLRDMTGLWRALYTTSDTHTDTHVLL